MAVLDQYRIQGVAANEELIKSRQNEEQRMAAQIEDQSKWREKVKDLKDQLSGAQEKCELMN